MGAHQSGPKKFAVKKSRRNKTGHQCPLRDLCPLNLKTKGDAWKTNSLSLNWVLCSPLRWLPAAQEEICRTKARALPNAARKIPQGRMVTLDGAEQSSFVRGNGEQLLQRITATPLPGWDRISIALMSYQACVSHSWQLRPPFLAGKTKFSATESALAALLRTAGQLDPILLQKASARAWEPSLTLVILTNTSHIGRAIWALPAPGSFFSSTASHNGAAHPDKAIGKRHGVMCTGSRNYLDTRGMEMLH
ncbi:uncharacterized protein LOC115350735 [Aquila chrysaetos chrysaetos]|uniref:uncharacterized protein LOC115350735 n=1 Tax=Aquila chrysaetos chrysaetos TaxID=223781 RepID=UPI001176661E|nr:uncharacterized protein LOC115350735 [Aquila chrysaetos chrysaetos]XP_040984630.1 uncharacterized protein LOC115350735 [Aquila chrysaetos chrysaetos]